MSKFLRRSHMYLALFLTPWVLIYALSTMAMNHRAYFRSLYGGEAPEWVREAEREYRPVFPAGATPRQMAVQVLTDLGLEGAFNAGRPGPGGRLVIQRLDPLSPRRITFTPADGRVLIEKQVFRTNAYLERMHRRRGYQHDYAMEDAWAFSVDLFIVAMIFWAGSGLWLWWELRTTRRWGALCLAGGLALFGVFLLTI